MDAIGRSMLSAALATLALRAWSRLRRMFQKYRPATVTMACRVERQRGTLALAEAGAIHKDEQHCRDAIVDKDTCEASAESRICRDLADDERHCPLHVGVVETVARAPSEGVLFEGSHECLVYMHEVAIDPAARQCKAEEDRKVGDGDARSEDVARNCGASQRFLGHRLPMGNKGDSQRPDG